MGASSPETKPYNYLVVGAGMFGACFARIATDSGQRVLVLDQRDHIGGNCYTETQNHIHIHRYGPHIFHTSNEAVWKFLNRFCSFQPFINSPLAYSGGKLYNLPFNMNTFYQMWGLRTPAEVQAKLSEQRLSLDRDPANLEEQALTLVGDDLYRSLILGYTQKQWQQHPRDLPPEIIKRLPLRFTYDNNYFNDRYQGIPAHGYTALFQRLLEGLDVRLSIDFLADRAYWQDQADVIVYTGKIDAFFDYAYGELAYRSLRFEHEWHDCDNFQGNAVINYCDPDIAYTRMIEHRHFDPPIQSPGCTIVTREYPIAWHRQETPYYPINDAHNMETFSRYQKEAQSLPQYLFGGRLAEYRYYDMHAVVGSVLTKAQQLGLSTGV